ncbi:MAG: cation:proton antiporter [Metallosphaera sp.]|uniref:Sodium/hydrogen exchanger n=1 Tax=Metallosphaera cuprina (strain Ar-4) TaxID=1006006 RepID=F4FYU6_METCR|nr:cation:proton antiporter [Metallosphaera cuprina]AEB94335.1 sodium/hydrogen exchanger [Metallosphaera cuprina Ar-4]
MNVVTSSLLYIGIMLVSAKLMEEGFSRLGLTPFVGAILIGLILGRGVLNVISLNDVISFVTSLGIIFLLFLAGAEEFGDSMELTPRILVSSLILTIVPFIVVFLFLTLIGVSNPLTVTFPLIMTSVGPMTRLLMDTGLVRSDTGRKLFYQGTLVEIISVIVFAIVSKPASLYSLIREALEIVVLFSIILFVGPKLSRLLEEIESFIKVREVELAFLLTVIMVTGYVSEIFGFNSAIAALFLGFLLRDYLGDRPDLKEKMHGLTYGFFEPLFFVSIGLYFAPLNLYITTIGLLLFVLILSTKFLSGYLTGFIVKMDGIVNGLGVSSKGGVDASLLISAFVLGELSQTEYSYSALSITLMSLTIPLIFKLKVRGIGVEEKKKPKFYEKLGSLSTITPLYATMDSSLREIINMITERGARAIVVVDECLHPIGLITVQQLLEIDPSYYSVYKARDLELKDLVIMEENRRVIDALRKFRATETAVIAVVDKNGKLVQTIYERELLRVLNSL